MVLAFVFAAVRLGAPPLLLAGVFGTSGLDRPGAYGASLPALCAETGVFLGRAGRGVPFALAAAVRIMASYDVTHVLVVEDDYPVGIVSALDVARATGGV